MSAEKRFPIMPQRSQRGPDEAPGFTVPWALVEPLRDIVQSIHGQSLERLAQRGGLSRYELGCLLVGLSGVSQPQTVERREMPVLQLLIPPAHNTSGGKAGK